jgi:hypothetical protein
MNRALLSVAGLIFTLSCLAQTDTTGQRTDTTRPGNRSSDDTIRVGSLIIVRGGGGSEELPHLRLHRHYHDYTPRNVSTNWVIIDLGIANYDDKTNYASAGAQTFAPGANANWFRLRHGTKSVDVNIWLFMQRLNLIKHVVNLKYGLGIELNNYRYLEDIRFKTNPTRVIMDTIHYSKNKLAADYLTVPFLLNFNFTPHRQQGYGFSVGASVGWLYSSRQKFVSKATGKEKTFDDFDMEPWKISYIAELQLGFLKLYGSWATKSMFSNGLDQTPYTAGIRIGFW